MSLPTATLATYEGIGIREDLEDTIWDLFPMDTWALTNLDKIGADNTLHEWQLDSLAAATLNASLEGDDAQYGSIDQPIRMKNYLQISTKALVITNTMEAVKKAGRKSEMTRQLMKKIDTLH